MTISESLPPLDLQNAAERARQYIETIEPYPTGVFRGRGIVTCAGGMKYYTSAWVLIKVLRMFGCQLPIQVWYLGEEERDEKWMSLVEPLGVECVDACEMQETHPHPRLGGWECKPYAILHCPFEEVLFLDADNVPLCNPAFLFDDRRYCAAGAVFWPDVMPRAAKDHPEWLVFDVPHRDELEQESGQMVVHKRYCWEAIRLCNWYNEHSDFFYRFIHGDKDTFRFAWHRMKRPFAFPPRQAKLVGGTLHQFDLDGQPLFQHRCHGKWSLHHNLQVPGFALEEECRQFLAELKTQWNPADTLAGRLRQGDRRQMAGLVGQRFEVVSAGFAKSSFCLGGDSRIVDGPGDAAHSWWIDEGELMIANVHGDLIATFSQQPDGSWKGRGGHNPSVFIELVRTVS